jgi:acylphosphatase
MKKCLRIIIIADFPDGFLQSFVAKHAQKLGLEGTAQLIDRTMKKVRINVCGSGSSLDEFLDLFHHKTPKFELKEMEVEPFLKDKDFRSVFRIIE